MTIAESDWKTFKKIHAIALERFSQGILDESQAICDDRSLSAHDRCGKLYRLVQKRDKEMAGTFDDFRRSSATFCLRLMVMRGLLTDDELSGFSTQMQHAARDEY